MPKFDVDDALVRKLAGLLAETGLTEIEYEVGSQRIRVTRGTSVALAAPSVSVAMPAPAALAAVPEGPPPGAVLSPMVGTAYAASTPGANPFIKVGDRVAKGQTLLIIEAMKVMNPIPAPHAGTVQQILFGDGRPVEFGEVLLVVN
jgi:acetyl-CoA carboxylase biotin carboxyl carrier protein